MVTVGIKYLSTTDEYRVFWQVDNKDDEAKAYYTDDAEDAVNTLIDTIERAQASGTDVKMADAQYTKILVGKYRWLWLQNTLKRKPALVDPTKLRVVSEETVEFNPKTMGPLITGLGEYRLEE